MNVFSHSPVLTVASLGPLDFLHTMKGPQFLGLFFGWFLVTWVATVVVRSRRDDEESVTLVGVLCFEALGVARIVIGSFYGMERWGFLIGMMIVGGLIFFVRASHFDGLGKGWAGSGSGGSGDVGGPWFSSDSGGSSSSSSSSCSSSSGGGGCGGGGGGCGGCGGGGGD